MADTIRVLHVDDDPDFLELSSQFLKRTDANLDIVTETSATDGLDRLHRMAIDCVVSDYQMPDMDGIEFLEAVREEFPDLPFILFTGRGSEEVASEAIAAGATDYLQKQPGSEQYQLLVNRIMNSVAQARSQRRATNLERLRTLASDINQALVRAETQDEILRECTEIFVETAPYRFAGYASVDAAADSAEMVTSAGEDGAVPMEFDLGECGGGQDPVSRAIEGNAVVVESFESTVPERWGAVASTEAVESVAVVPVPYLGEVYGVLIVVADQANVFDAVERDLLGELGADIGHALHARSVAADLRAAKERFQALFENAPGPVIAGEVNVEADEHIIVDVNDAFVDVFGYAADEVIGKDVAEVIIPEDASDEHADFRSRAARGEPVTEEVQRLTVDGAREFLLQVVPFGTGDRQQPGWFAWFTDITEQKRQQAELAQEHSLSEAVIETSIDGLLVVDEDGNQIAWNQQYLDMWDIPSSEMQEGNTDEVIDYVAKQVEQPEAFKERIASLYDQPFVEARDEIELQDGRVFDRYTAPVMGEDGTHFGRIWVFRDITDQQVRAKELERQNERLEEFASVVSHDLRNPLNVASGRLALAQEEVDSEHLEAIDRALDRMDALIDDLLTLAREGDEISELEPVELREVVDRCWETVETEAATLEIEGSMTMAADGSRLTQLLENVIRNAVQHGGDSVTVTVGVLDDGFFIEDDGPGIPESERERVFEAGYTTSADGTGFGLRIVKQIVEAHGWEIRVTAGSDDGTRFEVTGVGAPD